VVYPVTTSISKQLLHLSESWAIDIDYILGVPFEKDRHKRDEISRIRMKKYNLDNAIKIYRDL
jgi:hypothetical protein